MAASLNFYSLNFNYSSLINISILIMFSLSLNAGNSRASISSATDKSNSSKHGHHKWVGPSGHRVITVDVNGLADFPTVQAAVDAVPQNNMKNVLILIAAGCYM